MKACTKCGEIKPLSEFWKRPAARDGHRAQCIPCLGARNASWKDKNPERKKEIDAAAYSRNGDSRRDAMREYYRENKPEFAAYQKQWRADNAESLRLANAKKREIDGDRIRAKRRQHYLDNKSRYVAQARKREADQIKATPAWADIEKMNEFYAEAARLTSLTGVKHHVDHVFPLRGKTVCGLHVHTNLQVIPMLENLRKSNRVLESADGP